MEGYKFRGLIYEIAVASQNDRERLVQNAAQVLASSDSPENLVGYAATCSSFVLPETLRPRVPSIELPLFDVMMASIGLPSRKSLLRDPFGLLDGTAPEGRRAITKFLGAHLDHGKVITSLRRALHPEAGETRHVQMNAMMPLVGDERIRKMVVAALCRAELNPAVFREYYTDENLQAAMKFPEFEQEMLKLLRERKHSYVAGFFLRFSKHADTIADIELQLSLDPAKPIDRDVLFLGLLAKPSPSRIPAIVSKAITWVTSGTKGCIWAHEILDGLEGAELTAEEAQALIHLTRRSDRPLAQPVVGALSGNTALINGPFGEFLRTCLGSGEEQLAQIAALLLNSIPRG